MRKRQINGRIPIEEGARSVYEDLGYADAKSMEIKAQLVTAIAEIVQKRGLTQGEAARILGLTQPKVSGLLKGQFRGISERRLMDCLTRLGRDVEILVKAVPRSRASGCLTVHFG